MCVLVLPPPQRRALLFVVFFFLSLEKLAICWREDDFLKAHMNNAHDFRHIMLCVYIRMYVQSTVLVFIYGRCEWHTHDIRLVFGLLRRVDSSRVEREARVENIIHPYGIETWRWLGCSM